MKSSEIETKFLKAIEVAKKEMYKELGGKKDSETVAYGLGYRDGMDKSVEVFLKTLKDFLVNP